MKNKSMEFLYLFLSGAVLYPLIEILFRGHTHISMSVLGGICLVAIRVVDLLLGRVRMIWKAAVAALIITQLEFIAGVILNLHFRLDIWDYSTLPFQLAGQISLLFSFFWFLLSFAALGLFRYLLPYLSSKWMNRTQRIVPDATGTKQAP